MSFYSITLFFNRALKSANLGLNDIGDEGAVAISAALENNTALTELNLEAKYDGVKISATGAQAIAKMLAVNRALKSANLAENEIGDEGAVAISAALEVNNTLTALETKEQQPLAMRSRPTAPWRHWSCKTMRLVRPEHNLWLVCSRPIGR